MNPYSKYIGKLDTRRRIVGAESDEGFHLSNTAEMLRSYPDADVAPNPPPRSTICAKTNLERTLLPNAIADLARARAVNGEG